MSDGLENAIAIVGMAARLPGASTPAQFWNNLVEGVESITTLTADQLRDAGVPRDASMRPGYVRSAAVLDRMDWFDADFFGFSPKDAAIMDPQHRQFLAVCWEALEDAAHPPSRFPGAVGVFGGCGMGAYFAFNLLTNPDLVDEVGMFLLRHTGNDKDFLVTRASYLLDLQGPAVNVQTACSTSLVATHLAVQHLLSGECDMALAGGVTIEIPHGRGYQFEPGEILSPDGHCRAFDEKAGGTVFGSGAGVVVLRRLADAVTDGDHIYALIRGSAVNNDGARKVGYLAPSIDGQASCIAEALAVADVPSSTVHYVECHGTGTPMGDPIEVAALNQAFTRPVDGQPYCRIGSVKTNIGHLDTAAGVASLIKAALALQHRAMPPSLHFERPNPNIGFAGSPFEVNAHLRAWDVPDGEPRRAGVNSLGVGGTNAFAVLQEAPPTAHGTAADGPQLLVLSARNRSALDDGCRRLARHLREHSELNLADVAFTLHEGRHEFGERRVLAATSSAVAADLLESLDPRRVFTHTAGSQPPPIVFLLPGGGTQYPRMAADLYDTEPVFREHLDQGLRLAEDAHGLLLRPLLFPVAEEVPIAEAALEHASVQLPALMIVEHALARLLLSHGIRPVAFLGHSVGENVAACLAGTMTFADCLGLVVLRGRLMDRTRGGMLAVPLTPAELKPLLEEFGLDLAVVNAPELCVASGSDDALGALQVRLDGLGITAQRIRIHIAAHSRLLDPVLDEFREHLRTMRLSVPHTPWVSNRTGTWITPEQATDSEYWVGQLRNTVDFAAGIATIANEHSRAVFVEVGPGTTLSSLARMNPAVGGSNGTIHTVRRPDDHVDDRAMLLTALGRLWALGSPYPEQQAFTAGGRRRLSLPTYAFQEQRYFIEPGSRARSAADELPLLDRLPPDEWYWEPAWKPQPVDDEPLGACTYLVFADQIGIADKVSERLRALGHQVAQVRMGDSYRMVSATEYVLAAEHGRPGYEALVADLVRHGMAPDRVINVALLADREEFRPGLSFFHRNQELGFYNLVFFMQAWAAEGLHRPLHVLVATANSQRVSADDVVSWPEQSTVLGPVLVLPHELPDVTAAAIDVPLHDRRSARRRRGGSPDHIALVEVLVAEAVAPPANGVFAWRGTTRSVRSYRRAASSARIGFPLRANGTVLITGGLGGIGLTLAHRLFELTGARLVLLSREGLPREADWPRLTRGLEPEHTLVSRIRGVESLRGAGAEVMVVAGDVTNIERMREIVADVRTTFGGLHGIVHAAGVTDDRPLLEKEQLDIERVFAAKVYGTLVLNDVTADDPLDLFVVLSSTSAITGPPGQIDYVAANSFLNAFAAAHPGRVRSLGWGAWSDTGMAAAAVRRLFEPDGQSTEPCAGPFFDRRRTDDQGVVQLLARWPADAWFLDEHRTAAGEALLPGAAYLELTRQALREAGVTRPFEISDLVLLAPLTLGDGPAVDVRVTLTPTAAGYALEVRSSQVTAVPAAEGDGTAALPTWVRTAQAQIALRAPNEPERVDPVSVIATLPQRGPLRTRQHDHLQLGPRWNVTQRVHRGSRVGVGVAELVVPEQFRDDLAGFVLHPAIIDIGLCFAIEQVPGYTGDTLWVPVSAQSVTVYRPDDAHDQLLRTTVIASVSPSSSEQAGFATLDVSFVDPQGRTLVRVEGFTMKRLDGPLNLDQRDALPAERIDIARPVTRGEIVFRHNVDEGIRAAEGADAFERVLTEYRGTETVVSSLDVPRLRTQMDSMSAVAARSASSGSGVSFTRPSLNEPYLAPRDAIEETLVGLWQELLGVSQVGVHDSFFDLGGHSLIAVRLFARIRKLFSVDLPISVLFTAQTVEDGAALIRSLVPDAGVSGPPTTSLPRQYEYLVPMHPNQNGTATPFFLVAGMFGNVLNLRHLANQIGTDRPFYGIQARGLYGGAQPHESFEEMATDYLREIRMVQPRGPYLIGGFSGGGITALEIARQLHEAGEEVELLAMLDTPAPAIGEHLTPVDRIAIQLQTLRRDKFRYPSRWWQRRRAWRRSQSAHHDAVTDDEGALHNAEIEQAFYRALHRYEVQQYPGEIKLYRPPEEVAFTLPGGRRIDADRNFLHQDNGWHRYCDRVDVVNVSGDHDSMVLEPHVRVLAPHMRAAIEAAENRSRSRAHVAG